MEFDIFREILLAAKRLDDLINGVEKALDIQMGDGLLIDILSGLLNLLVDKCEWDTNEDSVIYRYAFTNKWGEISETYYIEGREYIVNSPESLHKYVTEKFDYEFTKEN